MERLNAALHRGGRAPGDLLDSEAWTRIDTIVVECTDSLLQAFGVRAVHIPSADLRVAPVRTTLAVIGFSGRPLHGSFVFSADESLLARTYVNGSGGNLGAADVDACDWSGELANQLLGRIKNKLLDHGVVIDLSTPTALSGLEWRVGRSVRNSKCHPHTFHAGDDFLQVRFEAVAQGVLTLEASNGASDSDLRREGAFILF